MQLNTVSSMLGINEWTIGSAYKGAAEKRNKLTHFTVDKAGKRTHKAKVCTICDRLITPNNDNFINISVFKDPCVQRLFHKDAIRDQNIYGLDNQAVTMLKREYTQHHFPDILFLNDLILSPLSYGKTKGKMNFLGCCTECKSSVTYVRRKDVMDKKLPKYAIANGLYLGRAPAVLEDLNAVELAMISPVRVLKRVFCFHAGAHKSIRGFHTMVLNNDVSYTYKVSNFFVDKNSEMKKKLKGGERENPVSGDCDKMTAKVVGHISQQYKKDLKLLGKDNDTIYQINDCSFAQELLFNSYFSDVEEYNQSFDTNQETRETMVLQEISSEYKRKIEALGRDNIVIATILDGPHEIIVNVSDVLKASQEGTWYEDRTIHQFCQRLVSRGTDIDPETLLYKIFDPLFLTYFGNKGMGAPNIDLSQYQQLIFPANVNNKHWGVIYVNTPNKIIKSYDSTSGDALVHHRNLVLDYVQDLSTSNINWTVTAAFTPRQTTQYDCGIFLCCIVYCIVRNIPIDFTQVQIDHCRPAIAMTIAEGDNGQVKKILDYHVAEHLELVPPSTKNSKVLKNLKTENMLAERTNNSKVVLELKTYDIRKTSEEGRYYDCRTIYFFSKTMSENNLDCKIFDTLFFTYEGQLKNATKETNIFDFRLLIFPVNIDDEISNKQNIWGAVCVNVDKGLIESFVHYDTLITSDIMLRYRQKVEDYLEVTLERTNTIEARNWRSLIANDMPRYKLQDVDSGVWLCCIIYCKVHNLRICFERYHVDGARPAIALTMWKGDNGYIKRIINPEVREDCSIKNVGGGRGKPLDDILNKHSESATKVDDISHENHEAKVVDDGMISVILCGPFTSKQKQITLEKTRVRPYMVKRAIRWLQRYNVLYRDVELSDELVKPLIIEEYTEDVDSKNSNIEEVYEITSVFPDDTCELSDINGGYQTTSEFKKSTLQKFTVDECDREDTLIARSSSTILKDYIDTNLILAFPLQFPFGVGNLDIDKNHRSGMAYYKYLANLKNPCYHLPEWVLVLNNMCERKRMVTKSFVTLTNHDEATEIGKMEEEDFTEAIERFLSNNKEKRYNPSDIFVSRLKAVTGAMANSPGSAFMARRKMLSMISFLGLPSILFTITPDDSINFRITVMAGGLDGSLEPPSHLGSNQVLKDFVIDCESIRSNYPGLCAFDFQNVISITISELIGWDETKHQNKGGTGIFGDIDAFSYAVEEQGRKTLHAHFILWVRNWNQVLEGLSKLSTRNFYAEVTKRYTEQIMMTEFHTPDKSTCVCKNATFEEFEYCNHQDLRNLRCQEGTTSLGGKSIAKCKQCEKTFSSNDLVHIAVNSRTEDWVNSGNINNETFHEDKGLFCFSSAMSRQKTQIELYLMNQIVDQAVKGERSIPPIGSDVYKSNLFFVNALKNCHSDEHCSKCFKYDHECRMKYPKKTSESSSLTFDRLGTASFGWKGEPRSVNMYHLEPKRSKADSFSNVHNAIVSVLFGCNNNIIAAVTGASIMYITLYASKNTGKDEKENFIKAATEMAKKAKKNKERREQACELEDEQEDEQDQMKKGIRSMIAASMIAASGRVCSGTMAAFLLRNGSRYHYSHNFAYINTKSFLKDYIDDITFDSTINGTPFLRSQVADYIYRPTKYNDLCLYDSVSLYTTWRRKTDNDTYNFEWMEDHISGNRVCLKKRKRSCIPIITYMEFEDTRKYGGKSIDTADVSECSATEIEAMENNAKMCCLLFIPFRKIRNLKDENNKFLPKLKAWLADPPKRFISDHVSILENIQAAFNSFGAGRPKDPLEATTETPPPPTEGKEIKNIERDVEGEKLIEDLLTNLEDNMSDSDSMRSQDGTFTMATSVIRECGSNGCGSNLISAPLVDSSANVFILDQQKYHGPSNRNNLYKNVTRITIRKTDKETNVSDYIATGDIGNIRNYGQRAFRNDRDQQIAFECIVAAFAINFFKKHPPLRKSNRKRSNEMAFLTDLRAVNNDEQLIGFLSGAGGTGKSWVINSVMQYCQKLCANHKVPFTKRTIVVTAMTGSAAVSIFGETAHSAFCLNRKINSQDIDEWTDTLMIIVDEISFASEAILLCMNKKINQLKEKPIATTKFGDLAVLFAGDFTQLEPVKGRPVYLNTKDDNIWYSYINTFIELKSNHRFGTDKKWGDILQSMRTKGSSEKDMHTINSRVVNEQNNISDEDIPRNAVYATSTNIDKASINEGIFAKHVLMTHKRSLNCHPQLHTICIKASNIYFRKPGTRQYNRKCTAIERDLIHSTCSDAHIKDPKNKRYDPMLKLYHDRPLSINRNIDVTKCMANGAMCKFKGIIVNDEYRESPSACMEKILIDGFAVNCIDANKVKSLVVEMMDGNTDPDNPKVVELMSANHTGSVHFPIPLEGPVTKNTHRVWRAIKFNQFPINVANARTVHKLQGRSIKNLVVSTWNYTGNWVYVVLSRKALQKTRPMSELCRTFLERFRKEKIPPVLNDNNPYKRIYLSLRQNKHVSRRKVIPTPTSTIEMDNCVQEK